MDRPEANLKFLTCAVSKRHHSVGDETIIEHPLYQSVVDDPQNDQPRLLFADWMDESGDPRGDFIRMQLDLANSEMYEVERRERVNQVSILLDQNRSRWNGPVHRYLGEVAGLRVRRRRGPIRCWDYDRGFIHDVMLESATFLQWHDVIRRIGPLERLRLLHCQKNAEALMFSQELMEYRSLCMAFDWPSTLRCNVILRAIARSDHLKNIQTLKIRNMHVLDQGAQALANSTITRISKLDVSDCMLTLTSAATLLESFGERVELNPTVVNWLRYDNTYGRTLGTRVSEFIRRFFD